jgi:hypothetical protein
MSTPVLPVAADFIPPAGSTNLSGVARSPTGALYITTEAPDTLARTTNGLLMTNSGVLYCEDVTP